MFWKLDLGMDIQDDWVKDVKSKDSILKHHEPWKLEEVGDTVDDHVDDNYYYNVTGVSSEKN